jgi:D-amino-acid dehydrogenase
MPKSGAQDIIIIGGGIIGTSCAYMLAEAGASVTVLEQGEVGLGCSYGNAGWVTPCFSMPLPQPGLLFKSIRWLLDPLSPLHIKPEMSWQLVRWLFEFMRNMNQQHLESSVKALTELSLATVTGYEKMAKAYPGAFDWHKQGLLMVALTEDGLRSTFLERDLVGANGVPSKTMTSEEVAAFEPALQKSVAGGVFFPDEAHVEPHRLVQTLRLAAESKGVKFRSQTEVFDWIHDGHDVLQKVRTTKGDFTADRFLLATGTWSTEMARKLALRVPILGGKGYSMMVPKTEVMPRTPMMILEKKIAITPHSDRLRIAGTLELVRDDRSISPRRLQSIWDGAREYVRIPDGMQPNEIWRGLRPCTPDGLPLLGNSNKWKNLTIATGHQMLGLQSAWGSAELICDIVNGVTPRFNPKPFDPNRY